MDSYDDPNRHQDEALQALIDSVDQNIPSSLFFVSGGSYILGSSDSNAITSSTPEGTLLEYRISQKPRNSGSNLENGAQLDKSLPSPADSGGSMEIDALVTEFKSKKRQRPVTASNTRQRQRADDLPSTATLDRTSNLKISGLTPSVTPELLTKTFMCYGPILSSKVMIPRDQRIETKTYGFVLFADPSAAETAKMERDGSILYGSMINLDWAAPPDPKKLARMLTDLRESLYLPATFNRSDAYYDTSGTDGSTAPTQFPSVVPPHLWNDCSSLSARDRSTLQDTLKFITPARSSINSAMEWIIERTNNAPDIVQLIAQHFSIAHSNMLNLIACFFLVSDVLHNAHILASSAPDSFGQASLFSHSFYSTLPHMVQVLGFLAQSIPGRISSQFVIDQMQTTISTWRKPGIFMPLFLDNLIQIFQQPTRSPTQPNSRPMVPSNTSSKPQQVSQSGHLASAQSTFSNTPPLGDVDGTPISNYPLDGGLPIDFETLLEEELLHRFGAKSASAS